MKHNQKIIYITSLLLTLYACKKADFLDKKPSTNILTPTTLTDFQQLLDNTPVLNFTGGLPQLASDDYVVNFADWQTGSATERNSYIWAKDIYSGDVAIRDWNYLYQGVFYSNSVLDGLAKSDSLNSGQAQYLKGWALFTRAFCFYDLTRSFCKAYDPNTANSDLGIPLRLKSGIDYNASRSTLQQSLDQIFSDLNSALTLLPAARPSLNLNRPSKIAVYALLARISLDMRDYGQAENYADQCLNLYSTLIDYNTISQTSANPFSTTNDELIYTARQVPAFTLFTPTVSTSLGKVSPDLLQLYSSNDLRLLVFFSKLPNGSYYKKRGYFGTGNYAFTGLATDEVFLIKAECLARKNQTGAAMDKLNQLLIKRYSNKSTFTPVTAASPAAALSLILGERRKELPWRGLRWYDLKRLNADGGNITLTRSLNGVTYTLPPSSSLYAFPIPDDEIALSGIQQNLRQ
jgi:hypothetical protein